jgi:AcrR family transcriptional regulator
VERVVVEEKPGMPKVVDRDEQMANLSRCAAELITRIGLEQTSLRKVAEEYGCTKGMVQYYFEDKEALLYSALLYVTESYRQRAKAVAGDLRGLKLIESRYMALLPLNQELHAEWAVRVAFYTRASTTPAMQKLLSQHYQRDLRAGIKDLEDARRMGEIKPDIELADAYRTIMSAMGGVGLTAVMNPAQLAPRDQIKILQNCIDALRV